MFTLGGKIRRTPPALVLVLTLVAAVCFWGLHYKLSLYQSAAARSSLPAAKLLSQKERPISSSDVGSLDPPFLQSLASAIHPTFLVVAIAFDSRLMVLVRMQTVVTEDDSRRQDRIHSRSFMSRPPPAPIPC